MATDKIPFYNIHTHRADERPQVVSLLNREPADFSSIPPDETDGNQFFSVGVHPWHAAGDFDALAPSFLKMLRNPCVKAVGECGLDRLSSVPFPLQLSFFRQQLQLAAITEKPIILHCVKAVDDLLALLHTMDWVPPLVWHGFRGKPQMAQQLLQAGVLLSFGSHFNEETVAQVPSNAFFLETDDDAHADILEIYSQVAALRKISTDELKMQMHLNYLALTE